MPGPSGFISGITRPGTEPSQDRNLKPRKRSVDYPYDKPTSYGQPRGIDNMGAGFQDVSQQHTRPLIPKDISHGPWDPETGELEQEASSYPGLFSKSSDTGMGGTIPGTAGGWAGSTKDWDAEDEVERAGSRHRRDESVWDRIVLEMGMHPESMGEAGIDAIGLELDHQRDAFRRTFQDTLPRVERMHPRDLVSLLIDLDPEYAAETLAPDDADEGRDMYRSWGSYALGDQERNG